MSSRDEIVLSKIMKYCEEIRETHAFFHDDQALFCDEQRGFIYRNAVTMAILQIGELAKHLSQDYLKSHPQIPWKQIIRTRDVYAHHYGSIEYEIVWQTSKDSVAELTAQLKTDEN